MERLFGTIFVLILIGRDSSSQNAEELEREVNGSITLYRFFMR
jgi:hypothetical protein